MPDKKLRQSIRLKHYDYSQAGAYFVTICTKDKNCLFGEILDGLMILNQFGEIAETCWADLAKHYPHVESDVFMVMPNHVHGIIVLADLSDVGAGLKPAPTEVKRCGLSEIVRAFKTFSSRQINELRNTRGIPVWQRNYYEHVIRNEYDLNEIREYIVNNPLKWELDKENPINL
jgi:REP element-mobilizing transposase RayT